jgi:hypothetical protein
MFAPADTIRTAAAVPACMGGWCRHRNGCALHLRDDRRHPVERLCSRGEERPVSALAETFATAKEMP